jgi:hypothetical protein
MWDNVWQMMHYICLWKIHWFTFVKEITCYLLIIISSKISTTFSFIEQVLIDDVLSSKHCKCLAKENMASYMMCVPLPDDRYQIKMKIDAYIYIILSKDTKRQKGLRKNKFDLISPII